MILTLHVTESINKWLIQLKSYLIYIIVLQWLQIPFFSLYFQGSIFIICLRIWRNMIKQKVYECRITYPSFNISKYKIKIIKENLKQLIITWWVPSDLIHLVRTFEP